MEEKSSPVKNSKDGLSSLIGSSVHAFYETAFILLPVLVWGLVILSVGPTADEFWRLPALPFASLAVYSASLRDGVSAFHQDTLKDTRERELIVIAGLIGVVISSVLLTLAVLSSRKLLSYLHDPFYVVVWSILGFGILLVFVTKAILIRRKKYGH